MKRLVVQFVELSTIVNDERRPTDEALTICA